MVVTTAPIVVLELILTKEKSSGDVINKVMEFVNAATILLIDTPTRKLTLANYM
jgi:hypothetical protein